MENNSPIEMLAPNAPRLYPRNGAPADPIDENAQAGSDNDLEEGDVQFLVQPPMHVVPMLNPQEPRPAGYLLLFATVPVRVPADQAGVGHRYGPGPGLPPVPNNNEDCPRTPPIRRIP